MLMTLFSARNDVSPYSSLLPRSGFADVGGKA